jgi:hypothetical protein
LVPEELRVKMIQLGVSPSMVARRAFVREVMAREGLIRLAKAREKDPRIKLEDLRKRSKRIRRLLGD